VQPYEALTILPHSPLAFAALLPIVTIVLAAIFNFRAAHNIAEVVRESLRKKSDL
jgi:hypothetical protein